MTINEEEKQMIIAYRQQDPITQANIFKLLRIEYPKPLIKKLRAYGYDENGNEIHPTAKIITGVFKKNTV